MRILAAFFLVTATIVVMRSSAHALAQEHDQILFIGDSHSTGKFGARLDKLLRATTENRVWTYASCGSSPSWWFSGYRTSCGYFERNPLHEFRRKHAPTPRLKRLIVNIAPTIVVIALGANFTRETADKRIFETSRRLAECAVRDKARCVWIGPPHIRKMPKKRFDAIYEILERAVEPYCRFIDSRPYTHYPATGGDGIHYDGLGSKQAEPAHDWADGVFEFMRSSLTQ